MQQFMLVGRVGNNVSYFDSGKTPVARVSIADNIQYRDPDTGERKQYTTWIPVIGFGQRGVDDEEFRSASATPFDAEG